MSGSADASLPPAPLARLRSSLANGDFADVTFVVGGEADQRRFPAIKALFASASPIFAAMLYGSDQTAETRNSEVRIVDMSPTTFNHVLKHVYFEQVGDFMSSTQVEHVMGVIRASDKYQLWELRKWCGEFIRRQSFDILTSGLLPPERCNFYIQRAIACKAFLREEYRTVAEEWGNFDYESDDEWAVREWRPSSRVFGPLTDTFGLEASTDYFEMNLADKWAVSEYVCGARQAVGKLANNDCRKVVLANNTPAFIVKVIQYYAELVNVDVHHCDKNEHAISEALLESKRLKLVCGEEDHHGVFAFLAPRKDRRDMPGVHEAGRCVVMLRLGLTGCKGVITTNTVVGKAKGKAKAKGSEDVRIAVIGLRDPSHVGSAFMTEVHMDDVFFTRHRSPPLPPPGSDWLKTLRDWATTAPDHWLFTPLRHLTGTNEDCSARAGEEGHPLW